MCFYGNCFVFTLSHWAVCARWAPRWKEEHHDVCRHLESYSSAFRLSVFCFRLSAHVSRQGRNWGVRHAPWPQGHQEVWHWWGHRGVEGHPQQVNVADAACNGCHVCNEAPGHFSAFNNWSSSSKPSWGSGWLSPLLMIWRPGRPEHKKVWWHEARLYPFRVLVGKVWQGVLQDCVLASLEALKYQWEGQLRKHEETMRFAYLGLGLCR